MKVSIITATYNRRTTIGHTLRSIQSQSYPNIEHVIVDGGSTDGSVELIEGLKRPEDVFISEPDKGIYDAWNKGLALATGDVIGFLNSDDFFSDTDIVTTVVSALEETQKNCIIGDIQYVSPDDINRVTRYYSSKKFHPGRFASGYMPAHPTLYARRDVYDKVGSFRLDYEIAADFELMVRIFHTNQNSYHYIPRSFVNMRTGGVSTASFKNRMIMVGENIRACRENNISTNRFRVLSNRIFKLLEFRRS